MSYCLLDRGDGEGGQWLVRIEWRPAGWSVCLPLLIFPCTIKSRSSLLAPAHPAGPGYVCVCLLNSAVDYNLLLHHKYTNCENSLSPIWTLFSNYQKQPTDQAAQLNSTQLSSMTDSSTVDCNLIVFSFQNDDMLVALQQYRDRDLRKDLKAKNKTVTSKTKTISRL